MTNMRNEIYIICLEVFNNLSFFLNKSTDIFSMIAATVKSHLCSVECQKLLKTVYVKIGAASSSFI